MPERVNKKEIDEILKKAEKASKNKNPPSKEKTPSTTEKAKTPEVVEKPKDKLDLILKEVRELKVTQADLKKRQDDTESFLNSMVIKPAGQNPNDENQVHKDNKGNEIDEKNLENLSDEEKMKLLERQTKERAKEQGITEEQKKEQDKGGNTTKEQGALTPTQAQTFWLLGKVMDNLGPVVQQALASKKGNSEHSPLDAMLTQVQAYGQIQNALLGNFFNFFKTLTPQQRETVRDNLLIPPEEIK